VSSSSSVISGPVARLLGESFAALEDELPTAHARLCAGLAGRAVAIDVDGERFVVALAGGQARVASVPAGEDTAAGVRVATSRGAILAVIDARRSLVEAVLADEVRVVGELDRLVEAHQALVTYVHGAVRCPSFLSLLQRFRTLGGDPSP
jgi:hypothetical protein